MKVMWLAMTVMLLFIIPYGVKTCTQLNFHLQ